MEEMAFRRSQEGGGELSWLTEDTMGHYPEVKKAHVICGAGLAVYCGESIECLKRFSWERKWVKLGESLKYFQKEAICVSEIELGSSSSDNVEARRQVGMVQPPRALHSLASSYGALWGWRDSRAGLARLLLLWPGVREGPSPAQWESEAQCTK